MSECLEKLSEKDLMVENSNLKQRVAELEKESNEAKSICVSKVWSMSDGELRLELARQQAQTISLQKDFQDLVDSKEREVEQYELQIKLLIETKKLSIEEKENEKEKAKVQQEIADKTIASLQSELAELRQVKKQQDEAREEAFRVTLTFSDRKGSLQSYFKDKTSAEDYIDRVTKADAMLHARNTLPFVKCEISLVKLNGLGHTPTWS